MEVNEDLRRKAVSAVLDKGKSQVSVRNELGLTAYRLRFMVNEEKARRQKLVDAGYHLAAESAEERLHRLAAEWGEPELYVQEVQSGLKRAHRTHLFFDYVIGGPPLLVAGILNLLITSVCVMVIIEVYNSAGDWLYATGVTLVVALVDVLIVTAIWAVVQYFKGLIFRSFAPFAYAVTHLQEALEKLEANSAGMFRRATSDEEHIARRRITRQIGKAAHILDLTLRPGRPDLSRMGRAHERDQRKKVAAYLAAAEDMLWNKGGSGRLQAIAILQIAAYETVLRNWSLHEFSDVDRPQPISVWRGRVLPGLKGLAAAAPFAAFAWAVFGPENQTPRQVVRAYLQSRGLWSG